MKNDEKTNHNFRRFSGKAFGTALAVAVLAAGTVTLSVFGSRAGVKTTPEPETTEKTTYVTVQIRNFAEETTASLPVLTTVAAELPTEIAEAVFGEDVTEEPATVPPKEFRSPLSLVIGADYSMGVPVFSATMSDYRTHNGVDFVGVEGEDVCAVAEGDVTEVVNDPVWGVRVTVDHGDGTVSAVSGLADDEKLIAEGTHVYAGSVIGRLGTVPVEAKDASHVHLEIRCGGRLVDPLEILGFDGTQYEE